MKELIIWNSTLTKCFVSNKIGGVKALSHEASSFFSIPTSVALYFALIEDGTTIEDDDFLSCLNDKTEIVALPPWEKLPGVSQRLNRCVSEMLRYHENFLVKFKNFLGEVDSEKFLELSNHFDGLPKGRHLSNRKDDPDWFRGEPDSLTTKEDVMRERAKRRIRGYYYDSKELALKKCVVAASNAAQTGWTEEQIVDDLKMKIKNIFIAFAKQLRTEKQDYFFDRSDKNAICTEDGTFSCEGPFDSATCPYLPPTRSIPAPQDITDAACSPGPHIINPYENRESLVLFQTWNLDHIVERSRTVVPGLVDAVKRLLQLRLQGKLSDNRSLCLDARDNGESQAIRNPQKKSVVVPVQPEPGDIVNTTRAIRNNQSGSSRPLEVNIDYFFDLLFTRKNLKLVHTVCHKKSIHSSRCLKDDLIFKKMVM